MDAAPTTTTTTDLTATFATDPGTAGCVLENEVARHGLVLKSFTDEDVEFVTCPDGPAMTGYEAAEWLLGVGPRPAGASDEEG